MSPRKCVWNAIVAGVALAVLSVVPAQAVGKQPVKTEDVTDGIARLIYADGTEVYKVEGGAELQFVPSPPQTNKEPKPTAKDISRGYITFAPNGRDGVLPEYIPVASEITSKVSIFACPGEYEFATFAVRPLKDLGTIKFSTGDFIGPAGARIPSRRAEISIVEPTLERVGLSPEEKEKCRWIAKWLRPDNTAKGTVRRNVQVYVDMHVPHDAKPGVYSGKVTVETELGKTSDFVVSLKVLPLKLARPMSWGFFIYDWPRSGESTDQCVASAQEQRRAGMTQCVISPGWLHVATSVSKDGAPDLRDWDRFIEIYRNAGFEDPPVLALEGLMYGIADAMGKTGDLKFSIRSGMSFPGVKAEEVPNDVREFASQAVRGLFDHSQEAKWPQFYAYYADEPAGGDGTEKVRFMGGVTREVAPRMRTAETIYTHAWWKPMANLVDLDIVHYVHPCNNADANRRWREFAKEMGASKLYGIDFFFSPDTFWEGRQVALTAEKGALDGMLNWTQWIVGDMDKPFDPYRFLFYSGKCSPMCYRDKDGRLWRSLPWIGIREGVDDSRYVRTLRAEIEKTRTDGRTSAADLAEMRLKRVMSEVPWVPGVRASNSRWNASGADAARAALADAAIRAEAAPYGRHEIINSRN